MRSLRQLSRSFRSSPGATVSLLGISALAIGASAAIWSAANAVLLRPLPYAEPDRLVLVWNDMVKRDIRDFPFPPADFEDLRTTALGASAWGIIRRQFLEALVIGIAGLGAGTAVALVILRLLKRYAPADLPRFDSMDLHGLSLTVAALAAGRVNHLSGNPSLLPGVIGWSTLPTDAEAGTR